MTLIVPARVGPVSIVIFNPPAGREFGTFSSKFRLPTVTDAFTVFVLPPAVRGAREVTSGWPASALLSRLAWIRPWMFGVSLIRFAIPCADVALWTLTVMYVVAEKP